MRTDAHLDESTRDAGSGFPTPSVRLGNDVVDLAHRACRERRPGDRFLERVLDPAEREWLGGDQERDTWMIRLWALWAAKETAFKVVSKLAGAQDVFRHRGFVGSLELEDAGCRGVLRIRGRVRGPEVSGVVTVEGSSDGEHVHLVGWGAVREAEAGDRAPPLEAGLEAGSGRGAALADYRTHFSDREWEGIRTVHGAEARLRARARLEAYLGAEDRDRSGDRRKDRPSAVEILTSAERPGRTPPRIRVAGVDRPDLDLSLSHHGRFVAWALLVPDPLTGAAEGETSTS